LKSNRIFSLSLKVFLWHNNFMPRRASTDENQIDDPIKDALRVVEVTIGEPLIPPKKNRHAQALSRLGASKGGKARAANLSEKKRKEIARKAAEARWKKAVS
jgi:hypothetical protein